MYALPFPMIDPIALQIGPFAVRWYALAYIAGIVSGWRYSLRLCRERPELVTPEQMDDFIMWLTLGIILGGRVGYVLFYNPLHFLANPLEIPALWHGGMSFHGGLMGVLLAMFLFARKRGIRFFALADVVAVCVPFGLFFGRMANFINGELYGRATDLPWAIVFPSKDAGPLPRHPSQLYEGFLEGVILFAVLWLLMRYADARRKVGMLSGTFLIGYGCARFLVEFAREPDVQLGYLAFGLTMGQYLTLPMLAYGAYLVATARRAS
ncbi:MAG: prolipoprotein diacylglyceryl transferase [Alphaproteobacteria bacterium]|nr:prolipoprotein diacylglyceryl transferase [Alphaproteobacteria bacterium]